MTGTPSLSTTLREAGRRGRARLVPFLVAGDPTLDATAGFLEILAETGAGAIELGVPHSDPIADGPVIQAAGRRALAAGATVPRVLELVRRVRERGVRVPILLFGYYNPVLRMGLERFARSAARAGAQGALVVDLPPEEADELRSETAAAGLETAFLASPTTSDRRLDRVAEASTGFVYYAARLGVTGARTDFPEALRRRIAHVRERVGKPLVVGFGIETPDQVREAAGLCDGIAVGTALVRLAGEHPPREAGRRIRALARGMVDATRDHGRPRRSEVTPC